MGQVFSVPLFFIILRETLEASIIISVLLSLVENLVDRAHDSRETTLVDDASTDVDYAKKKKKLVRRMRLQIWAGALVGLIIALAIGGAFIAVFFTTLNNLWSKTEEIWEGTFSLVAAIIIFFMGLTMLRIDRSKLKWRKKLEHAFDSSMEGASDTRGAKSSKWTLFLLPLITVLREGLEAVVFVGGVALGQPAKSIPLAAITGLVCGLIIGYFIYASSSQVSLTIFLVVSTNILFLLGAGLFSKSVGFFETYSFIKLVGSDVAEAGNGPGSYRVQGNVWHLTYGNPEDNTNGGYQIFNSILGWNNNATIGTILSYVFYWLAIVAALVYMKWSEGRLTVFGRQSAAGKRRQARLAEKEKAERERATSTPTDEKEKAELEKDAAAPQSTAPELLRD